MSIDTLRLLPLLLFLGILGCNSSGTAPPIDGAKDIRPEFTEEYRIGFGDTLQVDVYRNPDLAATVPVRPDGKITVPIAGDVPVGGHTPEEVGAIIAQHLGEYVRDPIVTVTVTTMGAGEYLSRVRITGAVGSPSSLPFRPGMTVLDVVLDAGGVTEFANARKTVVYRSGEKIRVRLDRILERGDLSSNLTLRPGDTITVPEGFF